MRTTKSVACLLTVALVPMLTACGNADPLPAQTGVTGHSRDWRSTASSEDGSKRVAAEFGGHVYTSSDGGRHWTARLADQQREWVSVSSSADGSRLVAAERQGDIYASNDGGVTWTARGSNGFWRAVSLSADGTQLTVVDWRSGKSHTSANGGVSWTANRDGGGRS